MTISTLNSKCQPFPLLAVINPSTPILTKYFFISSNITLASLCSSSVDDVFDSLIGSKSININTYRAISLSDIDFPPFANVFDTSMSKSDLIGLSVI